ncbi:MAG: type VI secretion system baseplate subunit TssE [Phycisphaeraceae bacterium]|nr:type VI secretion system baseplate subunit TssE [Phycisphaeraceae bacterium]MCW5763372.1 type VI secretion system baseplate subunit TssE [Phycisphaeraceae bacterium]
MAELTPSERLQPCLLDRLTDEEPEHNKESRNKRVFSLRQIRQAVLRDLSWLLNTPARSTAEDLSGFPNVESSVVNFGIVDLSGTTASGVSVVQLEAMVARAIQRYEPRMLPGTIKVRAVKNTQLMNRNTLMFEITGDLWAQPIPDPMYLKTEVDLETGQCMVQERIGG